MLADLSKVTRGQMLLANRLRGSPAVVVLQFVGVELGNRDGPSRTPQWPLRRTAETQDGSLGAGSAK